MKRKPLWWQFAASRLEAAKSAWRAGGWRGLLRLADTPRAGTFLLLLSFLVGLTKLYYGRFVDEADTLTLGWLISEGYTLYQDVFSHHFPLPYFWAAGVVSLVGNSFVAMRLSVLLLQVGLFAAAMRLQGHYLAIGLASLVWNLINQFHRGQQAIYATFEGLFMAAAFLLILAWLAEDEPPKRGAVYACAGGLMGLAVLSDPLMVYAFAAGLLGVFLSAARRGGRAGLIEGLRRLAWAAGAATLLFALFALYLFASGTLDDFYQSAIWFNAEIYAKYENASPDRMAQIGQNLVSGFKLFDARWVKHLSPFIPLETYRSVKLEDEVLYFSWIFSSFTFRLALLACIGGLLMRRQAVAALFVYLFAAALLAREDEGLYAIAFTLVSLTAGFYALTTEGIRGEGSKSFALLLRAWAGFLLLLAVMLAWLALRGGFFLLTHPLQLADGRHVTMYHKFEANVRALTSNQEIELAVYPINPIVYFVTEIPPASKYTFMYPWVAEIGQQELIEELRANPAAFVWINTNRKSGSPDSVVVYMADALEFLDAEYVSPSEDLWMSPELAARCPP